MAELELESRSVWCQRLCSYILFYITLKWKEAVFEKWNPRSREIKILFEFYNSSEGQKSMVVFQWFITSSCYFFHRFLFLSVHTPVNVLGSSLLVSYLMSLLSRKYHCSRNIDSSILFICWWCRQAKRSCDFSLAIHSKDKANCPLFCGVSHYLQRFTKGDTSMELAHK